MRPPTVFFLISALGLLLVPAGSRLLLHAQPALHTLPSTPTLPQSWTASSTSDSTSGWRAYRNNLFEIRYPSTATLIGADEKVVLMRLPLASGSTLIDKRVQITTTTSTPERCLDPRGASIVASSMVHLNGLPFKRIIREEFEVGSQVDVEAYSTMRRDLCVRLEFILQSVNPESLHSSPPPAFDPATETVVFSQMLSTFRFIR
jgi:hypothetical protein